MEYIEQLRSYEWLNKRQAILERDSNLCNKCHNSNYLSSFMLGISYGSGYNSYNKSGWLNTEDCMTSQHITVLYFGEKINIAKGSYLTYIIENKTAYLSSIIDLAEELKLKSVSFSHLNSDEPLVLFHNKKSKEELLNDVNSINWIYCKNLHIHHTYYQIGKLAWEYPDNALITLCWQCHESLHKNSIIRILDANGKILEERKVCNRCFGAGWFPEYTYVENGICFECRGKRYI